VADYAERVDTAEVARPTGVVALIRPDAYVAWACEPGPGDDRAALVRDALARWCGASSPAAPGSVGSVIDGLSQTG